jgi:dTDP-4-amino-4,6-dideoxygalactose transaminase
MKVPATVPYFSEEDIEYITKHSKEILRGESFLSMFKYGAQFEKDFASYIGTDYAVACNSGTSALELIFRSLGVKGKEIILPSNTFLATAIAIRNAGATPIFADCKDDMCIDIDDIRRKITDKTIAVTIVHIGGLISKDILDIKRMCDKGGFYLVEDAAQAHGSSHKGVKAGNFGLAAGFSFFSTKVMTTGEGGMVTTNDEKLSDKMKSMREFGKIKKGIITNYHKYFGYNWRMPEVSALMGIRQLMSLDKFINRRQEVAKIYNNELGEIKSISIVKPSSFKDHNFFKYILILNEHDREMIHKGMENLDISPSGYVYEIPLHKQPVFPNHNQDTLSNTERLCKNHFCLPIFYSMTDEQAHYVASSLKKVLENQ